MGSNKDSRMINLLLATFAGLGLPRTLSIPTPAQTPVSDVYRSIFDRLPESAEDLTLTTVSNKQLLPSCTDPIASLLPSANDNLLSLRLSRRLCGGKGGFGSQLRAAGGRMSSRKNRDRQNLTGSNRNLDGRRLRTIEEAKRLADYLTIKPEMERKEKEERKKRWQDIVDSSDRREEEIRSGKVGANQGRLNADYVEAKENAEAKTREAVLRAMKDDAGAGKRTGSETSAEEEDYGEDDDDVESGDSSESSDGPMQGLPSAGPSGGVFGWDDFDSDASDSEAEYEEDVRKPTGHMNQRASQLPQIQIEHEDSHLGDKGKARALD